MDEIIRQYGSVEKFLESVKDSLVSLQDLKKELNLLKGKKSTLEETEKKLQETKDKIIDKTIKDRKKELLDVYNQKLVDLDSSLKKAKKEKEKERQKIVKEKVSRGTKTKNENILFLKNNLKSIIKEKKLNSFLNTDLYYYIIAPSRFTDYIIGAIIFILCFVIIPLIICFIFKDKMTLWTKIMLFVINTFIFGIIYLTLCHIGKCDKETMREIRELRKDIKENQKDVYRLTKEISKEKIEENDVYTRMDRMIETINLEIKNLKEKQEKDIEIFENATKNTIINEIEKQSKKDFLSNEKALKATIIDLEKKEDEYNEINDVIENEYIKYIQKDELSISTIEKLIEIISKDNNMTLEDALKKLKK